MSSRFDNCQVSRLHDWETTTSLLGPGDWPFHRLDCFRLFKFFSLLLVLAKNWLHGAMNHAKSSNINKSTLYSIIRFIRIVFNGIDRHQLWHCFKCDWFEQFRNISWFSIQIKYQFQNDIEDIMNFVEGLPQDLRLEVTLFVYENTFR